MAILIEKTLPNGSTASYHVVKKFESSEDFSSINISLLGYVNKQAYQDQFPYIWFWPVSIPAVLLTVSPTIANIENLLVSTEISPFFGGLIEQSLSPLEQAKQLKWFEIKAVRGRVESDGIMWNGNIYDTDQDSRNRISAAALTAVSDPNVTFNWTTKAGVIVALTAQNIIELNQAITQRMNDINIRIQDIKQSIFSATELEQLNDIAW